MMLTMFARLLLPLLVLATAPFARSAGEQAGSLRAAWAEVALNLFADAHRSFAALPGDEARLGEAITGLQLQPKTAARVERSAAVLRRLAEGTNDPDLSAMARFYLARVEHFHRLQPDLAAAMEGYAELIRRHPGHPLADEALARMASIELYQPAEPGERAALVDRYGALAADLPMGDARRDLHLLLADAVLRFGLGDAIALEHLLAAEATGIRSATVRAATLVSIGELAQRLGQLEVARIHYESFLELGQRDSRRRLVEERLAALTHLAEASR
jgi:hypothetical protein